MIASMTGMGRAEAALGNTRLTAEARSVNHKYLEVTVKLPNSLALHEDEVRQLVRRHVRRGYVQLYVSVDEPSANAGLAVDRDVVRRYRTLARQLRRQGIGGQLDVNTLLAFPGVVKANRVSRDEAALWQKAQQTIERSLQRLVRMRRAEGRNLATDLRRRLAVMERQLGAIRRRAPRRRDERLAALRELLTGATPDAVESGRVWEEVAGHIERMDIAEECVRFDNHVNLFRAALAEPAGSGRKLAFILQELLKEANTISSKAFDTAIAHRVIRIKDEIESLREQVQNIE